MNDQAVASTVILFAFFVWFLVLLGRLLRGSRQSADASDGPRVASHDELARWCEQRDVVIGDDGLPEFQPGPPGPPVVCLCCGVLSERSVEVFAAGGPFGKDGVTVRVCGECVKLGWIAPRAYVTRLADRWEKLHR